MLAFFTDALLTRPITAYTPKLFCVPQEGGTRTSTIYLGDPYKSVVQQPAAIGADTLYIDQTTEFPAAGLALIGTMQIAYTGATAKTLTGVTGITSAIAIGDSVTPDVVYVFPSNIIIAVAGGDAVAIDAQIALSSKLPSQASFGFRGTATILGTNVITKASPLAFDIQMTAPRGIDQLFVNASILCSGAVIRQSTNLSAVLATEQQHSIFAQVNVYRHNQGLVQRDRFLPLNRQVFSDLPGLIVGQSRWRDDTTINVNQLVPTNWNVNVAAIGADKFISGIASTGDLGPISVEESENSLYLRVTNGFYFTGPNRFYLPAGCMLEFLISGEAMVPADQEGTTVTYNLLQSPAPQTTVFVGTWTLDSNRFYQKATTYRNVGFNFEPAVSDLQFTLCRKTKTLTLNQPMPPVPDQLLGTLSGQAVEYFDLPIFPIANVRKVYVDQGAALGSQRYLYATAFTFNSEEGTIKIPAIPGSLAGQPVYAVCDPAVAVLYEQGGTWQPNFDYAMGVAITVAGTIYTVSTPGLSGTQAPLFASLTDELTYDNGVEWICSGPAGTRRLMVDLNPAYSGISSGFVYLMHTRSEAQTLQLAVDKPRIAIPSPGNTPIGLVAYGPVYSSGDYALMIVTAYDCQQNPVPNVKLQVIPAPGFTGLINYQDPTVGPILVTTGGDGTANLIYTPNRDFGFYLPIVAPTSGAPGGVSTTTVTCDTLNLSEPVALSQFYNLTQGWMTEFYSITNDIGLYGKAEANTTEGEIPFVASGTPGTSDYKTNGCMISWLTGSKPVVPIAAYDAAGNINTSPLFSGFVSRLVFASALPSPANLAAYFLTYTGCVSLSTAVVDSNVISNSVLLQIEPPALSPDNPWLILDDSINGVLNSFRLGWSTQFNTTPGTALVGG